MNLPNKLTLFRIFLVVPFLIVLGFMIHSFFEQGDYSGNVKTYLLVAGGIFLLAMITDALDGYIARKNKTITTFGKLFDPISDKFITTSAFIALSVINLVPFWATIIFVLRDIFVDGSRNIAASNNIKVEASIYGKLKTIAQTIAILIIFFATPFIDLSYKSHVDYINMEWKGWLLDIPVFISLTLSIVSGVLYFKAIKHLINTK